MLTAMLLVIGVTICSGMCAGAMLATKREERQTHARESYRLIWLRNGVTEEIPFGGPRAPINVPGMVEVHPHRRTDERPPVLLAASTAPVREPAQLKALPTGSREEKNDGKVFPKKETKFYKGYPQGGFSVEDVAPEALAALKTLIDGNETRKTVLSWAIFGSSGGKVYNLARPIIEEALKDA